MPALFCYFHVVWNREKSFSSTYSDYQQDAQTNHAWMMSKSCPIPSVIVSQHTLLPFSALPLVFILLWALLITRDTLSHVPIEAKSSKHGSKLEGTPLSYIMSNSWEAFYWDLFHRGLFFNLYWFHILLSVSLTIFVSLGMGDTVHFDAETMHDLIVIDRPVSLCWSHLKSNDLCVMW